MPYLPKKFEKNHSLCEFLISQVEEFVLNEEFKDLKVQKIDLNDGESLKDNEHVLDFLLRTERNELHDKILINQITSGILMDICYFVMEALEASRKKRMTVTFALLRKPFVSDLKVLLRIFFTEDFLIQFNKEEKFEVDKMSTNSIKELLEFSEQVLITKSIKSTDIFDFIYNQELEESLINLSNQALHPSTTRNKNNLTGLQNINFIFSQEEDIHSQWEYLYTRLPVLLIYLIEILEYGVFALNDIDSKFYMERIEKRAEFMKSNGC